MTDTRQESLIREAIAAEAEQAVDHRTVLANLHGKRSRRRPFALFAAAGLTAAATAVAVIVPLSVDRTAAPASVDPAAPPTAATTRTVLLIGLDGAANTDSVVLARVGADGAVSAASLPRDSLVDIPGFGQGKLNSAYARAHAAAQAEGRDGAAAGVEALKRTVEALTGVAVDHYAALEMAAFSTLADAVGGVEVCLKRPARDPFSGVDLPAGSQSLTGAQALAFIRQRHGLANGELDRIVRQHVFLRALATKVVQGDPAKLPELARVAATHLRVDPGWDLAEFAARITPTVRTAIIPLGGEVTTPDHGHALSVDPAAVRAFMAEFFAEGATGTPTGGHSVPPPAAETHKPGRQPSAGDCVD
ncbi:LytR family transcriptional attenuator [Saccharothrix carnea]|uniref:LytR family transcriptional attenuator n=1 Tax=Saccharothrix carnea TaxID=1280637 RepID=A0A2P8I2F8_SACCR|nr:LCP family protein [Saccharothrix carnea]PSL52646.1 LytR family transcriptional attenuator [Saccharothrix carnea]